ncbi:hypothetical protein GGR57DRAFT_322856 [Xylariaceae sp. FL1272]|nr:hypothetical protein GGR57DRAFT_322856 [Xylariaceae sp. FL1272]
MNTENSVGSAVKARERGNELYKKGALNEAISAYKEAALLDPLDPYPLSNLSAAYFEAGAYADSVEAANKALENTEFAADTSSSKAQKLLIRSVRALLHLSDVDEAKATIKQVLPGKDLDGLLSALDVAKNPLLGPPASVARDKLLRLPRLRPSIQDEPDFFGPGHDMAESLFTPELSKSCANDTVWSFMMCGVGDARHVFRTIASCHGAMTKTGAASQNIYFTILDHKPAVLARVLIFLYLLEEASNPDTDAQEATLALLTVSYLFCAQLIPSWVEAKFQDAAENVQSKLSEGQNPVNCCHIRKPQMNGLETIIDGWREDVKEMYSTSQLRWQIPLDIRKTGQSVPGMDLNAWQFLEECKREHRFFDDFSVMLPPSAHIESCDPTLADLVSRYGAGGKSGLRQKIDEHLNTSWSINPTLIDLEWEDKKEEMGPPDLGFDPFHIIESFGLKEGKVVREAMSAMLNFFIPVSRALHDFKGRLMVEVIVGDMMHALESIRHDSLERPDEESPKQYHVIHLSNIPDYVRGALTSFLYAAPLLKQGNGTGLTSNVLRNPPQWKNVDQFNAEYLLMHDRELIRKHFGVKLSSLTPKEDDGAAKFLLPYNMTMSDYKTWESTGKSKMPLAQRMSRGTLFRWLYSHLLKLCLPYPRPKADRQLVYAPLNLTAFPRLLDLVIELGYPTHWVSSMICAMASGEVTTTARAPRKYVLTPAAIDRVHESRTMSVQPWADEFATLAAMWRSAWPSGTLVLVDDILPVHEHIGQYTIQFPNFAALDLNYPHFALVFWNQRKYGKPPGDLRPILLDDDKGDLTTSARAIRANGVKIVSTFAWVRETNTAGFWLRSDVVDKMAREGWYVYIWRIDVWGRLTEGMPVEGAVTWRESYDRAQVTDLIERCLSP